MARRRDTDVAQIKLRLPERVRKRLEEAAKKEYRSLNGEIVRRLEKSLGLDFPSLLSDEIPDSFSERPAQEPKVARHRRITRRG
jgi:hypothetical protein